MWEKEGDGGGGVADVCGMSCASALAQGVGVPSPPERAQTAVNRHSTVSEKKIIFFSLSLFSFFLPFLSSFFFCFWKLEKFKYIKKERRNLI